MRSVLIVRRAASLLALAPLVAALHASPAAAAPPELQVTDLGTLAGGCCSFAEAVNERGDVVGTSDVGDTISHAFLWRDGEMTDLGTLGGLSSVGQDINERGDVVGYSNPPDTFDLHAFLWRDGEMTDLGTLGGPDSFATGVNDRGDVVGYSSTAAGEIHAFLWRDGTMTDLGGGTTSLAYAVNNRGAIAGDADQAPTVWLRGTSVSLDLPPGAEFGSALAINDRGDVAGYGGFPSGLSINRATLWRHGVPVDLGTLGGPNSQAFGVNNRGQVVGVAETPTSSQAFLWQHGTMTSLPSLAGGSSGATDINNRGQVVGNSTSADGFPHAVLWR
jgi:probable HAF family extracellular repeat protein